MLWWAIAPDRQLLSDGNNVGKSRFEAFTLAEQKIAPWLVDPRLPCACGSNKTYCDCCEPLIKAGNDSLAWDANKHLSDENVQEAELLYKAHFVQYLEWVYAHTLPLIEAGIGVTYEIVDVEALIELTKTIVHCLYEGGKEQDILPFLKHVEVVVPLRDFTNPVRI